MILARWHHFLSIFPPWRGKPPLMAASKRVSPAYQVFSALRFCFSLNKAFLSRWTDVLKKMFEHLIMFFPDKWQMFLFALEAVRGLQMVADWSCHSREKKLTKLRWNLWPHLFCSLTFPQELILKLGAFHRKLLFYFKIKTENVFVPILCSCPPPSLSGQIWLFALVHILLFADSEIKGKWGRPSKWDFLLSVGTEGLSSKSFRCQLVSI